MDWRQWKLEDWNRALVSTLFFDQERFEQPIRRIEASAKFLARVTGDSRAVHAEAHDAFVRSFGRSGSAIRAYFSGAHDQERETRRNGYPSTLAPLYLTLLAGSADENTYLQGDFRDRFATLLKPVAVGRMPFADLPAMWKHVKDWSRRRANQHQDCRVLELPPVRWHDRLISHSKLLAFPGYQDELKLQSLLERASLDSDSPFRDIARHLATRLGAFSQFFQEEFKVFRSHVSKVEDLAAYQTPFWGAVEALTWESRRELSRSTGEFALGVDVSDPALVEFYMLADDFAVDKLAPQIEKSINTVPGRLRNVIRLRGGWQWSPALAESTAISQVSLARLQLWKRLKSGCLALYPDEYGRLTSDGSFVDGVSTCILVKDRVADELAKTSKNLSLKFREAKGSVSFAPWRVFVFEQLLERQLQRLADDMPDDVRRSLQVRWQPPRISFSGGVWDGQMLFLNPASVPLVGMPRIASGSFQVLDESGAVLTQSVLEPTNEDGRLAISSRNLVSLSFPSELKVSATTADGQEAYSSLRVTNVFPPSPPLPLADPAAWLVDGPSGLLSYVDGHATAAPLEPRKVSTLLLPRFERVAGAPAVNLIEVDLDTLPPVLDWLCEALALRFRDRAIIPFAQLEDHIKPASQAANVPVWQLRRLLLSSGLLRAVQKRGSPFAMIAVAPRTISLHVAQGECVARISGLLSKSERASLRALLISGEKAFRRLSQNLVIGIGVIELRLTGPNRIAEIATSLGLEVIDTPLLAPLSSPREVMVCTTGWGNALPRAAGLEAYNVAKRRWEPINTAHPAMTTGMFFRLISKQKREYWIFTGSGYMCTDSLTWTSIIRVGIARRPFAQVLPNGDCVFTPDVRGLPPSLVRWWLHRGGGNLGIGHTGELVFAGGASHGTWEEIGDWLHGEVGAFVKNDIGVALDRRRLALAMRKNRLHRRIFA